MNAAIPSMNDPDGSIELLREIIEAGVQENAFPLEVTVRARRAHEPWLVDELLTRGWLSSSLGRLVPTIQGLQAAGTPNAAEALRQSQHLFTQLHALYVEAPNRSWDPSELAKRIGLAEPAVQRMLRHLQASGGYFAMLSWDQRGGIGNVTLSESILRHDPFRVASEEPSPVEAGSITLTASNFLGLSQVQWSPEGVCLVAGPNGSGKTTLLRTFGFLRNAFQRNVPDAVGFQGGAAGLRRLDADGPPEVLLGVKVGDASWELRLGVKGGGLSEFPGETVKVGDSVLLRRASYAPEWYFGRDRRGPDSEGRTCLRVAWESQPSSALAPLVDMLRGFRYYHGSYSLDALKNGGVGGESDQALHPSGQNLFVVLRNWKAAPRRFRNQFDWVLTQARRAFPDLIEDIEFDPPVGQVVPTRFFPPGGRAALPMSRAADGMLVGLLHLTTVAGAKDGSVIAIDEMENQLHPHAIRSLLAAMREIAEERRLTILLTTHSPVLMNAFREHPEQFYVMEPGQPVLPVALDKLRDPDWLAHFELGDLYDRMEFGAPERVPNE